MKTTSKIICLVYTHLIKPIFAILLAKKDPRESLNGLIPPNEPVRCNKGLVFTVFKDYLQF